MLKRNNEIDKLKKFIDKNYRRKIIKSNVMHKFESNRKKSIY